MKLILRADVENLGRLGDLVEVKAGYGRNFLLPKGLAMVASPANLKVFELERRKLQARMDELRSSASNMASRLQAVDLTITMRVGENDKLYGSVTTALIADALAEKGIEIDRRRILLDAPIRTVGEFPVRVRLHADVVGELTVKVVPEERFEEDVTTPAPAEEVAPAEEAPAEEAAAE